MSVTMHHKIFRVCCVCMAYYECIGLCSNLAILHQQRFSPWGYLMLQSELLDFGESNSRHSACHSWIISFHSVSSKPDMLRISRRRRLCAIATGTISQSEWAYCIALCHRKPLTSWSRHETCGSWHRTGEMIRWSRMTMTSTEMLRCGTIFAYRYTAVKLTLNCMSSEIVAEKILNTSVCLNRT